MRYLILLVLTFTVTACCLVAPTPNPLRKPPLPLGEPMPRVAPYKWSEV